MKAEFQLVWENGEKVKLCLKEIRGLSQFQVPLIIIMLKLVSLNLLILLYGLLSYFSEGDEKWAPPKKLAQT
jgi:hypothetical protein